MSSIAVKAFCGADARRFSFDGTFEELEREVKARFGLNASLKLKFKDDEEEFVTVSSDGELREAIRISTSLTPPILRLHVIALPRCQMEVDAANEPETKQRNDDKNTTQDGDTKAATQSADAEAAVKTIKDVEDALGGVLGEWVREMKQAAATVPESAEAGAKALEAAVQEGITVASEALPSRDVPHRLPFWRV